VVGIVVTTINEVIWTKSSSQWERNVNWIMLRGGREGGSEGEILLIRTKWGLIRGLLCISRCQRVYLDSKTWIYPHNPVLTLSSGSILNMLNMIKALIGISFNEIIIQHRFQNILPDWQGYKTYWQEFTAFEAKVSKNLKKKKNTHTKLEKFWISQNKSRFDQICSPFVLC